MTFLAVANAVFWGAMIVTLAAVFPFRALAERIGMVDRPDNIRKLHKKAVPVGGGVVIFAVLTIVICLLLHCREEIGFGLGISPKLLLPLLIVSPFIVGIGLIDDKRGMSGKTKLLCQIIAASIIIGFAKYYSEITYFGIELNLHHLFYPLAVFWIIGMINSINLLDGADGVAVTVSFFMSLATAGIAYVNGHAGIALISLGLAGCLLGFFFHNRPTAKIYLGDTGSMFIGMALGTLMLRASVESDRVISICGPLAIVLIPMTDSFFAVIRRVNSGRTIFSPDRGHIHHLLSMKVSSSAYRVLLVLSLLVLPGCIAAVVGAYYQNDLIPVAVSLGVLSIAIATDLFGRRELFILFGRIKGRFRKQFHKSKYMLKNGEVYHIQGIGPWRKIWNQLVPLLNEYPCKRIQLDINIPNHNEDFFGEWENVAMHGENRPLHCTVTMVVQEQRVGTLRLYFEDKNNSRDKIFELIAMLSEICELSISQYLKAGELDKSFSLLAFDSINSVTVADHVKQEDAEIIHPIKRVA